MNTWVNDRIRLMSRSYLKYVPVICDKIFKNPSSFYCETRGTLPVVLIA